MTITRNFGFLFLSYSGLISIPTVSSHKFEPLDKLLIISNDDFWSVVNSEQVNIFVLN